MEPKKFVNPYENLSREDRHRTTIDFDIHVLSDMRTVHPRTGVIQTTINILLQKLHEQLLAHGFNEFNPTGYEFAVANATITLGLPGVSGSSVADSEPHAKADKGNDRRGTPSVARLGKGKDSLAADADGPSESKGKANKSRKKG